MPMPGGLYQENKERDRIVANETAQRLSQIWYETGQAFVQSAFDIQDRSLQYANKCLSDELETFKSNIDASQQWMQKQENPQGQQESVSSLMEISREAYKRNIALLQRITEQGTETFRANSGVVRDLTETLMKKAQDQQHMFF